MHLYYQPKMQYCRWGQAVCRHPCRGLTRLLLLLLLHLLLLLLLLHQLRLLLSLLTLHPCWSS
jgi:hypothetical protein